jgi:hypothetical protein
MEKEKKVIVHKKTTPRKKRSSSCYQKKVERITKWYNHLLTEKENPEKINPNNKLPYKKRELKELSYYIEKIKKPQD